MFHIVNRDVEAMLRHLDVYVPKESKSAFNSTIKILSTADLLFETILDEGYYDDAGTVTETQYVSAILSMTASWCGDVSKDGTVRYAFLGEITTALLWMLCDWEVYQVTHTENKSWKAEIGSISNRYTSMLRGLVRRLYGPAERFDDDPLVYVFKFCKDHGDLHTRLGCTMAIEVIRTVKAVRQADDRLTGLFQCDFVNVDPMTSRVHLNLK